MKKTTILNLLLTACLLLACLSIYLWESKIIFIMLILAAAIFLIMKWYVTATEYPDDYDVTPSQRLNGTVNNIQNI